MCKPNIGFWALLRSYWMMDQCLWNSLCIPFLSLNFTINQISSWIICSRITEVSVVSLPSLSARLWFGQVWQSDGRKGWQKCSPDVLRLRYKMQESLFLPDSSLHMLHLLTFTNILMCHANLPLLSRIRKQNYNFYSNFVLQLVSFSLSGVLVRQSQNQVHTTPVLVCSNSLMHFTVPTPEQSLLFYGNY